MGLAPPSHFAYDFSRKIFFMLYPVIWTNFTIWFFLIIEKLDNVTIVIICIPVCDVIDFEISISFLIKPFFTWPKKSGQLLTWNKKHFSSFFKGFLLKQINVPHSVWNFQRVPTKKSIAGFSEDCMITILLQELEFCNPFHVKHPGENMAGEKL